MGATIKGLSGFSVEGLPELGAAHREAVIYMRAGVVCYIEVSDNYLYFTLLLKRYFWLDFLWWFSGSVEKVPDRPETSQVSEISV